MLKDEPLEYIREQYEEKNDVLAQFGEQVSPVTFYEDVFCDLEMVMPIVVLSDDEEKKTIKPMSIANALASAAAHIDTLMGGCAYFNNWVSKRTAKDIYTFIIDMDNVYSGTLMDTLPRDWRSGNEEPFAKPTYIVNSGTGLHLYFVLTEPVPCYRRSLEDIDRLYRALAIQQSRRVYVHRQVHWFGQDFRMAGGFGKYGWENTVFRIGDRWDIDELGRNVGLDVHFVRYGEPKKKYPESQPEEVPRRGKRKGWRSNPAFYEYALETCQEKTKEGNRYTSLCALSVIAWKCNVDKDKLETDLLSLLPKYNSGATRLIRESEVYSAMKMYNEKAIETQRTTLENWQGWEYRPIKRNGRKREQHLRLARGQLAILKDMELASPGRPSARGAVEDYRQQHPDATKAECNRAIGADPKTIRKWWNV